MDDEKLQDLRQDYGLDSLNKSDLSVLPMEQFRKWLAHAIEMETDIEANAMVLSTVDAQGQPSSRVVLLKDLIADQLIFYTNHDSNKGQDVLSNPKVTVLFWWRALQRQVRIQGTIEKVADDIAMAYFQSRPIGSQIGAAVSPQSQVIANRQVLETARKQQEAQVEDGQTVTKPPNWGGYQIKPTYFEFWQGGQHRLHDRLRYRRDNDQQWIIERLAP